MDERKKIKLENTLEQIVAIPSLIALAAVAEALAPVVGAVQTGKKLAKTKKDNDQITGQDIKNALAFYGEHLLRPLKGMVKEPTKFVLQGKQKLKDYDQKMWQAAKKLEEQIQEENRRKEKQKEIEAACTPAALHESGVDSLLTLIKNAPQISPIIDDIGDVDKRFAYNGDKVSEEKKQYIKDIFGFGTMIGDVIITNKQSGNGVYLLEGNNIKNAKQMLLIPDLQNDLVRDEIRNKYKQQGNKEKQQKINDFTTFVQTQIQPER